MYDYVIVGAGSAGRVPPPPVPQDPPLPRLLFYAGPPDVKDNIHVPLGFLKLGRTDVDWALSTAPEPFLDRRRVYLPRGKTLGGSSSINAMVYVRGNRRDYDGWGIDGWSYDDLLPYFKRSEDNQRLHDEFHGTGGPLTVCDSRSNNPMALAFVAGSVEAGLARTEDFNGAEQDGAAMYQLT